MKRLTIAIVLLAAGAAHAEPPAPADWQWGVEPRFGVLVPTSKLRTFVAGGVEVDRAFGRLTIGADLALTRPSYDSSVMDPRVPGGTSTYTIDQTELVVGVLASYRFADAQADLVPHAGAGPVVQMLKSNETTNAAPGENTATQTKLGVEVDGGLDYRLGSGFLAGDLRVIYSGLNTKWTGSSNAGSLGLAFGYRFVF